MGKNSTYHSLRSRFLYPILFWAVIFVPFFVSAQTVVIPRSGYPYCQPFTGSGDPNSLPFTVARGDKVNFGTPVTFSPRALNLTGQSLRLTTTESDLRGYVFVDLPFSSIYGIKTSFEYFVHTPGSPAGLGDGLSFFMFDGAISAADFQIGGVGGSLGYAPHGSNNGTYNMGGLRGGYMGIGFDILGNFGNYQEKKYGGFHDPNQFNFSTPGADIKFYPDAVTIRGPVNASDAVRRNGSPPSDSNPLAAPYYDSYQFVSGKITSYVVGFPYPFAARVANGSGDLFLDPAKSSLFLPSGEMFRLGAGLVPADINCNARPIGYRKVFIDLSPTNNPAIPYTITVDMLVDNNPTPINILNNVPYPYQAPADLKVGFSASTGGSAYSTFDIRNVTVEVSSIDEALAPKPPVLTREVCINDDTEFEFEVDLPAENSYITCIQLYAIDPGPADNSGTAGDQFDCGLSGTCVEKCLDTRKTLTIAGQGTLVAELEELTQGPGGNFNTERKKAKLIFTPTNGFVGTFVAYYQVTDNYGLESDGTLIEITVNPEPQLVNNGDIFDPTCDGQNDGAIRNIIVRDLAPGYTYTWRDQNNNPIPVGNQTFTSTPSGNYEEGTFGLENINLGTYTLEITNPSVEAACNIVVVKTLVQEAGTPVIILDPITEICEQTPIIYTPQISSVYTNNVSAPPVFLWYTDPNRAYPIVNNSNQLIVNGNSINTGQITIAGPGDGRLTIASLPQGTYTFYVEVDDTNFPTSGNFCLQRGALEMVQLTVFPALQANVNEVPDWCVVGQGSISVTASGGQGTPTFTLFDDAGNQAQQNNTGNFNGLFPGDYTIEIETSSPTCFLSIPGTVEGPDQPLTLTEGPTVNAFCNDANGELQFNLSGGNTPYKTIIIDGTPISNPVISADTYTLSGLSAGTYTIIATDDEDCTASVQLTIAGDEPSVYGTTNDEICEGETATVSPQTITQSTSTPVFTWYYLDAGNYIQINNGAVVGGVTFSLDGANNLSVSGLAPQASPHLYYLQVTGSKVCPQGYLPAEIQVNPAPVLTSPILTMVSCNGGSDGSIQAQLSGGNLSDFQFGLTGNNGVNIGLSSNSGIFPNLPPGTYELTVRGSGGCQSTLSGITITEPPILNITITSKTDATCSEDNGLLTFTIAGGTPNGSGTYQIQINGVDIATLGSDVTVGANNDFTVSNLAPGSYQVTVEDANGCDVVSSETIGDTDFPTFAVQDIDVCEGQQAVLTPEIVSNPTGASPIYSWAFENPSSPGQFITIQNGDVVNGVTYTITNGVLFIDGLVNSNSPYKYYLTVSGNLVCPSPPLEAEIRVLQIPEAIFQEVNVSCFNANDGEIQLVSVTPSNTNNFTIIETGESNTSGNFSGLANGAYTIRVQEAGSPCFDDFPITLTQPEELLLVNPTFSNPTCGDSNGVFQFDLIGTTPNYVVLINGNPLSDYSASTTGQTIEVTNLPPGSYSVTVINENSCQFDAVNLFSLVNDAGVIVNMNPLDLIICSGVPALFNPTYSPTPPVVPNLKWFFDSNITLPIVSSPVPDQNGVTFLIESSTGQLSIEGLAVGSYTYFVEMSGPGICTEIEAATLEVFPEITATIVKEDITCFGDTNGSIQITPAGGNGNFEFSLNGSPFSTSASYTNLAAGFYKVSIRNDVGCLTEIDVEILGPAEPISINEATIVRASCGLDNGSISNLVISGGYGNYSVEWRKGSATGVTVNGNLTSALNLAPDTYFLLITDGEGCSTEFSFVVGESSDPVYEIVPPINACTGNAVAIRPVHIAPDPSLPPAAATEVFWYSGPGQTGLIQNGAHPTLPGVTYTIDDSDWLNPELVVDGLPSGTYEFYFFVVCTGQEIKIDVTVFDTPAVVFESEPISCFGDSNGKIKAISGTDPEYTYSINGATPVSLAELEALTFVAGTYQIEVITPAAGCPQLINVPVEGPSGPLEIVLLSELDPSCNLENGEVRIQLNGGNPDYKLTLNGVEISGFDASLDGVEVLVENLPGGTHLFELTDSQNCTPATLSITLDPLEVPEFGAIGAEICAFDAATGQANTGILQPVIVNLAGSSPIFTWYYLNASGAEVQVNSGDQVLGGTAQISPSGELELTGVAASDTPYKFLLEVTGPLVCPQPKIEVDFLVNFTPEVIFEKTDIDCFADSEGVISVLSGALPGYTYTLNTGESNGSGTFSSLPAGNYSVEISNGSICTQTVQIEITEPDELLITDVEFTDPTCDASNGEIVFSIAGGVPVFDILINNLSLTPANYTFSENNGIYTVQNLAPGTYSINVIDGNGCETVANNLFTLTNNPGIDIDSQPIIEEICEGQTAQLTPDLTTPSGVSPILRWYKDAAATQQITSSPTPDADGIIYQINAQGVLNVTNLPAGVFSYYLRISGPGICTKVTEATLTIVARPDVILDVSNISCFGANDGLVQVSTGHDPTYVYTLSNGESNSTGDFLNLVPGNYTLEVENTSGCVQEIDFEIEEPAVLVINDLGFTNPSCDEDNGEIRFEINGGTGVYTILINGQELNDTNFALISVGQEYTVKGLAPGTYSIQVTDENGCVETAADLFTLVNEAGILIGSNPLLEEIMLGEVATLTPDLTVPSGAIFNLTWYFDLAATQIINSDPNPASDGIIYLIDGNGQLTLTNLPPGTYSYYLEISGNGICVTLTEAIVIVKSPLTADIVTTPVTCFGGSDGSISVENIVGGIPPLSFSLDGVTWQSSPVFEDLPVGTYTIYITDPTITPGILTSFPGILIETTATEIVANTPDIIRSSCGLPNGSIRDLVISGGAGGYTFEWRKDDPISGELLTNGTLTGIEDLLPGTYYISVRDANGCPEVFSFTITEIPGPVYDVIPPVDACVGEPVSILPLFIAPNPPEPTASTEIRWYKEAGQVGLISNGPDSENPTIIYAIDATDWVNPQLTISNLPVGSHDFYFNVVCTGQEIKVDVNVFEIPELVFETSPVACFGDTDGKIISMSGDLPEYIYSLNGASPISLLELEALNLAAGNFTIEVATPAGCAQVLNVIIEGPSSALTLDPLIKIDPGCGADNGKIQGQITGGWSPYTVNLFKEGNLIDSFVQTGSPLAIDNLSIGLYSLEIIDNEGCRIVSDDLNLIDGPTQILIDNQEICEGSIVTLVATLDPPVSIFTIQWFFDELGTQPIISSPNPALDGVIYEISASGELTITGLPFSVVQYQYFATASGPDVCSGFVARPTVQVNEVPTASTTIISEQCFGDGGIITIDALGGNGGYEYSIDGVTFQTSNIFNVQQGTYTATLRTGDGCTLIIPDLIVAGPSAAITVGSVDQTDANCGQEDGSLTMVLDGGYGDFEVDLILNSTVLSSGITDANGSITFSDLAVGSYGIVVKDSGGCEISFENLVAVQDILTPINVNDVGICEGETATLAPSVPVNSPDLQFIWYFDAAGTRPISSGISGAQTYTIATDGRLTIEGLSANGTPHEYFVLATGTNICRTLPERALVNVTEIPNLRVSNPSIVCDPEGTVDLTKFIEGFNPSVYDYNVLSPSGSTMRLDELTQVDLSGDYRVSSTAKGTTCWNQPQRIRVIISESLLVAEFNYLVDFGNGNIFQNEDIPLGEDVYFNDISQGNGVIWNWDFGDGSSSTEQNPVHSYNEIGSYSIKLRVVDSIGCESIYEMVVMVQDDFDVIIPNAFTPLGNKNQFFKPEYRGIASLEFFIFNTWGELIYTTTSLEDKGWNGTLNGSDAPNGNYVYRGRFVSRGGVVIEKSGVFILIR